MTIYWMGCVFSVFGAWIGKHVTNRRGAKCAQRMAVFISALPLFLIAALRYNVGQDYMYTYVPYFYRVWNGMVRDQLEPAYHLLNQLVVWAGGDYVWVFASCAALFLGFLFSQIFRDSPYVALSAFLVIGMSYYFVFLNAMRQMVGCAIALYSVRYIRSRDPLRFFLCMLAATSFHISCILFLAAYWIGKVQIKPKAVVLITVLLLLASKSLTPLILSIIRQTSYAGYIGSVFDKGEKGYIVLAISAAITLFSALLYQGNPKYRVYFNMQVLSMWIAAFSGDVALISRIRWLFGLPAVILLPMAIKNITTNNCRRIAISLVVICYVVYIFITIGMRNGNHVLPYQTIFSR